MNGDTPDPQTAGTRAVNLLILWKLVIFELFVSCAITAGTFYLATMPDDGWSGWTPAQRHKFLAGMVLSILVVIKSFTSKSFANLSKGNLMPPDVDGGNTQTWTRRQVDTVQTSSPPPPAPATPPPDPHPPILPK